MLIWGELTLYNVIWKNWKTKQKKIVKWIADGKKIRNRRCNRSHLRNNFNNWIRSRSIIRKVVIIRRLVVIRIIILIIIIIIIIIIITADHRGTALIRINKIRR